MSYNKNPCTQRAHSLAWKTSCKSGKGCVKLFQKIRCCVRVMNPLSLGRWERLGWKGSFWSESWRMGEIRIDVYAKRWSTVPRPGDLEWRRLGRRGWSDRKLDQPAAWDSGRPGMVASMICALSWRLEDLETFCSGSDRLRAVFGVLREG